MIHKFVDTANKLDQTVFSNEAISFQAQSKLYKDLTEVFELGFQYRKTIDIGMVANRGEIAIRNFRALEMCNYVKKFLMPEFTKVVHMHTGLIVTKVQVHTDVSQGPIGLFAVDLSFGDVDTALNTLSRTTGVQRGSLGPKVKEMMEMSKNFDTTTGTITDSTYGKDKKIAVKMYFDALFAYCLLDFIPNKFIKELTADELAAIMMHEIGHALTFVERAGDLYFQQRRITEHLNFIKKHDDIKVVIDESYPDIKESLTTILQSKGLPISKKHGAFLLKTLEKIKKANDSLKEIPPDTSVTIISLLSSILFSIFLLFCMAVMVYCQTLVIFKLAIELGASITFMNSNKIDKTSDTFTSAHNARFCERMADEFVSRHGASKSLSSALSKVFTTVKVMGIGSIDSVTLRESILFNLYVKFITFIVQSCTNIIPNYTYEENYDRLARIVQNAITPLKDPNVPSWLRKDLLEDYEQSLKVLKNYKSFSDTDAFKSFQRLLEDLLSPVTIIRNITNVGLRRDYEILHDRIDELMNNKLYYQSQKLLSLVGK